MRTILVGDRGRLVPARLAWFFVVVLAAATPFAVLLSPNPRAARPSAAAASVTTVMQAPPPRARSSPTVNTVTYDRYSLLVGGRRVVLFGGEYQYWRTPSQSQWPVVLREMRAAGLNMVSVGVSWQYQSPAPGVYDFHGIRDLGRFLDDAAAAGLYVVARPGPVYDAESNASNLPGWLLTDTGNLRANSGHGYCGAGAPAPQYAAAYTDWYRHVLPIIASRQITSGRGTVLALQIENEYSPLCGDRQYMSELHDLARQEGIVVPLIANNNTCCVATGAWHMTGDDGEPIVDIPAEDDYPCADLCPAGWNALTFAGVDTLEQRMRRAGLANAPLAVAELQGGYFTGWGQNDVSATRDALGPAFTEVLQGSVIGRGATIASVYMVAGGTSWGYLGAPNTETSYDYGAAIAEWGGTSPTYDALKRTGMFVDAFGDLLAATRGSGDVSAANRSLLYAARVAVDGAQKGAELIVLRNTGAHAGATALRLRLAGQSYLIPMRGRSTVVVPARSLSMLVAGCHLGAFHLLYSTSRPLTHAQVGATQVAVFYGTPGTSGETALSFAHAPKIVRADRGVAASYDAKHGLLLLDYTHQETPLTVVVDDGDRRLVVVLTGPQSAAHTWRADTAAGFAVVMGPDMVTGATSAGRALSLQIGLHGRTTMTVWSADGDRRAFITGGADLTSHVGLMRHTPGVYLRTPPRVAVDAASRALIVTAAPAGVVAPALPALTRWRFMPESPERLAAFDDRAWRRADEMTTTNPNVPSSDTLLADDYGFHYGVVWYRGRFVGSAAITALKLMARHSYSVWLNGVYLGSSDKANDLKNPSDQLTIFNPRPSNDTYADLETFAIPRGLVRDGRPNVLAVMVESLGHNVGFSNGQLARSPAGILTAELASSARSRPPAITWKIQGRIGGDANGSMTNLPLNASGLYGERSGWYRGSFDDRRWPTVALPDNWAARGLALQGVAWYRTHFALSLPQGLDVPLGLTVPRAQDKVFVWLNGVLIGRYWDSVGPQHTFYLPSGLLRDHGDNVFALAVWNRGHAGGLTGKLALQPYSVNASLELHAY